RRQTSLWRHHIGVKVEFTSIGVINFRGILLTIVHARQEHHLESRRLVVCRTVVECRGDRIPIFSSVFPLVNTAVGHNAAGVLQPCKPVHRVDLVTHPLPRQSRRIGPEESELKMLACIEGFKRSVHQESLPVRIFLLHFIDELDPAPPSGLVDIPGQFHHGDVAELSGTNKVGGRMVVAGASALRSDRYDLFGFTYRLEGDAGIFHGLRKRLFTRGVASGPDSFRTMQGMLKVGRADDHGAQVFPCIEFVVIYTGLDVVTDLFLNLSVSLLAFVLPYVGNRYHLEVQLLIVMKEAGQQRAAKAIGVPHNADVYAVVRAEYAGVALWAEGHRAEGGGGAGLDKISP